MLRSPGICVPYPSGIVARSRGQSATGRRAELGCEDSFSMAGYPMAHAGHGLHLEHGLRLRSECDSRFERVGNAMTLKQLEEVLWVGIDDGVGVWDVDTESVR